MIHLNKLFEIRSYLILWASRTISMFGTAMTSFALIVYVFKRQQTALSITLLPVCTILPAILFCFFAGTLVDRWDKKNIILTGFVVGAFGTLTILLLYEAGNLQIWHLYAINIIIGCMNAFQNPAFYVALSLLVPGEHYVRAGAIQAFSIALVNIVGPVAVTAILSFGGIELILICDLVSFLATFLFIFLFVRMPSIPSFGSIKKVPLLRSCLFGFRFLKNHRPLFRFILYMSIVNLLASLGGDGNMMPAMVLARTNSNEVVLGIVKTAVGLGSLAGSIIVVVKKPAKSLIRELFITCGMSFIICDLSYAISQNAVVWSLAAFAGNALVPFITANNGALMRLNVHLELQGRVFAARDTIQNLPYPIGLFLGGFLADNFFEPFMSAPSQVQHVLSFIVGTGKGSGIALMILITGIAGFAASILSYRNPLYRELDDN